MNTAFQVVAITDQHAPNGELVTEFYAATTETAEEALELAKQRLPAGWQVSVTQAFLYAPAAIEGLPRGDLILMS